MPNFLNEETQTKEIQPFVGRSVGGWLLVLCIVLAIVGPASGIYRIVVNTVPLLLRARGMSRQILFAVYIVIFGVLISFSFVAGLKLWSVKPGAVKFAKAYLIAYWLLDLAYFVFWILLLHPEIPPIFVGMCRDHVLGPMLSTVMWYSYLSYSRRVRETFPSG
jgi:hypothetical protein